MMIILLDNGKKAYRFDPHDLELLNRGGFVVVDDTTYEIGIVRGEWSKDEEFPRLVSNVDLVEMNR